jgi:magnesium chelatase family protein
MSLALVHSRALAGMDAPPVTVEVHLAPGLPGLTLVGLPDTEVREARDRVRAALLCAGFTLPSKRITINLAPADLPKESGRFDLPIALGLLAASGQIDGSQLARHEFAGELSLSGELRPIRGALAMALAASDTGRAIVLPSASADEAAQVPDATVHPAADLLAVCAHLNGQSLLPTAAPTTAAPATSYPDLLDVQGQQAAKRALEIAAAGQHSLLLSGPPGTGKSMLAARLPGILPPLATAEALESAAVLSVAGQFRSAAFGQVPYRSPHHSASAPALVGGGGDPRPGEISLAHCGILFLDELPEFARPVLEALREPLETGVIHIARAGRQASFPARFQLVAAMNPCPCGYLGHPSRACGCTPDQVARYRGRLSGPLLDRIDLRVEVPAVPAETLQAAPDGERSSVVRQRVIAARQRQLDRQGCANASLQGEALIEHAQPDAAASALLRQASDRLALSPRAYHRLLRVARTLADLAALPSIGAPQVAEALHYRRLAGNA